MEPTLIIDAEPPAPLASPHGLYSVATFSEEDRPVQYGVILRSHPQGGHGRWGAPYCLPGDRTKEGADRETGVAFPGTGVWSMEECPAVGSSVQEARQKAQNRLRQVEPAWAEDLAAESLLERATTVTGRGPVGAEAMYRAEGVTPVLHVRPSDVPELLRQRVIFAISGTLRTTLGSPVSVGAGYEDTLPSGAVFLTGPVTVFRNAVRTAETFDPESNQNVVLSERTIAVGWTEDTYRVDLDTTTPGDGD